MYNTFMDAKDSQYNARKVERIILNLYPATYESIAHLAFCEGVKPKDIAERAMLIGLQKLMRDEVLIF